MPDRPLKRLLIQGATGSIGRSTLDVVRFHPDRFRVSGIAANSNVAALLEAAREFCPQSVALEDTMRAAALADFAKANRGVRVFIGPGASVEQALTSDYDLLVNAQLGGAGMEPTMAALERGVPVALANKETIVAAGPLVMAAASRHGTHVIPIDSEHSAIFQCLLGESNASIRRIWLTTSGGPFWGRPADSLANVSVDEALAHPTWKMGPKITIDSATLFNKGLEVIEANRLFNTSADRIAVVAHRQSVVHSMVEFFDGSIKAQLSRPDMKLPILYALTYPERIESAVVGTDIPSLGTLTFEPVPEGTFPCLDLAYEALRRGGTAPAAASAADEIAVHAFLDRRICFTDIAGVIEDVLGEWPVEPLADLATVRTADRTAREVAEEHVQHRSGRRKVVTC